MDILVDFDGTVVTHEFPSIGKDKGAVPVLKKLVKNGHNIILFTMRSNTTNNKDSSKEIPKIHNSNFLDDAVEWSNKNKIPLYGINTNPTQKTWTTSPKAYGQLLIDDIALGVPLIFDQRLSDRPFVDWVKVEQYCITTKLIKNRI